MKQMPIRTTVIGSYPFPGWLEFASRHLDQFGSADLAEIQPLVGPGAEQGHKWPGGIAQSEQVAQEAAPAPRQQRHTNHTKEREPGEGAGPLHRTSQPAQDCASDHGERPEEEQ